MFNKFRNIKISYKNISIQECVELYNKKVCCVCDGDNRFLYFEEEK